MAMLLSRWALRYPVPLLAFIALTTALAVSGFTQLKSVSFLEGNLPDDDSELEIYRSLVSEFGSDEVIVLAISCSDGPCVDIFEPNVLELLRTLSKNAADTRGVDKVESLVSAGVLVGGGVDLEVKRLPDPYDTEAAQAFRSIVHRNPLLSHLVSSDLRTAAVVATLRPGLSDADRNGIAIAMSADARRVAASAGFPLFASGIVLRAATADAYVQRDLQILTPILVAVVALLLYWVFRHAASVGLALAAVAIPTIWAFGLMGWSGKPITPVVSTMPIVILVIGITDAVHFLVRSHEFYAAGRSQEALIQDVVREVGPPTTVTAITTALGFLSFLAGPIPSLREYGVFCAVGIVGGWAMTFTVLPIVVRRWSPSSRFILRPAFAMGDSLLGAARETGIRRPGTVLTAGVLLLAVSVLGITRIVPENDTMKLLGEGDPLVTSEQFLRDNLRPPDTLEVLYSPSNGDVLAPGELMRLESAERILREEANGAPIVSLLTILRLTGREIRGGALTTPVDAEGAGQLLLIAEAADSTAVRKVLTPDRELARMSAGYAWKGSRAVEQDVADVRAALTETLGSHGTFWLTGSVVLSTHLGEVVLQNQVSSFLAAFVSIFLVLIVFVRDIPLAMLGMIPNVFPVAIILGFMGLVGINLDVGTAMIASIVLGVSTDDTVYFLVHYQRARQRSSTVSDAVSYTFAVAGKPAVFSAVALAVGFFLLGFSSFQSLAIFGLLSGVAVVLAVGCELLLMPAILQVAVGRREAAIE